MGEPQFLGTSLSPYNVTSKDCNIFKIFNYIWILQLINKNVGTY